MLSAGNWEKTREVKVRGGDCTSMAGYFGTCPVQNYENFLCFRKIGAVAGSDRVAVSKDAVSVKEGKAEEIVVKDGLEEGEDGELGELYFETARDVWGGLGGVLLV